MKLNMNNSTGFNYKKQDTVDRGELAISYDIVGLPKGTNSAVSYTPIWVKFATNNSGLSTIESCASSRSALEGSSQPNKGTGPLWAGYTSSAFKGSLGGVSGVVTPID